MYIYIYCYVPISCHDDILDILIFLVLGHVIEEVRTQIKIYYSSYFLDNDDKKKS